MNLMLRALLFLIKLKKFAICSISIEVIGTSVGFVWNKIWPTRRHRNDYAIL